MLQGPWQYMHQAEHGHILAAPPVMSLCCLAGLPPILFPYATCSSVLYRDHGRGPRERRHKRLYLSEIRATASSVGVTVTITVTRCDGQAHWDRYALLAPIAECDAGLSLVVGLWSAAMGEDKWMRHARVRE